MPTTPTGPSMIALLRHKLDQDPTAPLLIDAHPTHPLTVTRAEFWSRVQALTTQLAAHGVGPGDCVASWLPNWSDTLVWQFAAVARGAHVIGINTRYNIEEATHVLDLARPRVVAVAHDFVRLDLRARLIAAAAASHAPPPSVAVLTGPHRPAPTAADIASYDLGAGAWTPGQAPGETPLNDDPAALAVAFTTSGSTGRPKLAAHSVGGVAGHAIACATAGGWTAASVTLSALPLTGVFSFVPAMATIAAGGVCLLEPVFDPDAIVDDMARHHVTHVIAADDIVARLAESATARGTDLSTWTHLYTADFNGRSEELAAWAETHPGLVAAGVYGSSELFALTSLWPASTPTPRRWRGGGQPAWPAIEVRAGDPDSGAPLPTGESGELQFRGPNVVDAYLGDPARHATVLTKDGWFRSGDLGTVNADGSFDYICRLGDALRLKGFLVEPAEIENRLIEHPAIAQAKVVGHRAEAGDMQAIAFVVPNAGHTAEPPALLAWCAATLARYKVPNAVHIIAEMPVTSGVNGTKVRAATLRDWAAELATNPAAHPSL